MFRVNLRVRKKEKSKNLRRILKKKNPGRLRLSFSKTSKHLYAQLIDDSVGHTLAFVSTNSKKFKDKSGRLHAWRNTDSAIILAKDFVEVLSKKGLLNSNLKDNVFFDRGYARCVGIVRSFSDAMRDMDVIA